MSRFQGVNANGEPLSSFRVERIEEYGFKTVGPSLTRQEFADECDINVLMSRYEATGIMPNVNRQVPQWGDVSSVPDLMQALQEIEAAKTAFMSLDAKVRREFDNDPLRFVEFAQDGANAAKLREWGLANSPPAAPPPVRVEVVQAPAAPGPAPGAAAPGTPS